MAATKYKIWAVGQAVNDGVSGSIHVGMATVAKKANATEPNIVVNEMLCNLLARALFLPCPPGALLDNGGECYFASLNFNLAGQSLPPSPIATVVSKCPELCWGILLFDVLVMNPDRHSKNLAFNRHTSAVQIFDHSRAFLPLKSTIEMVVNNNQGKLGIDGHCLKTEINTMSGFDHWVNRIKSLPDYIIEESIDEISHIGFPKDKKLLAVNFLKDRRNTIDSIINNNISEFPKLPRPGAVAAPAVSAAANAPVVAPQPGP